jgi:hypothetical protein
MAFFALNSEIKIGNYKLVGVHEVRVVRGIHGWNDSAIIKLPSRGVIRKENSTSDVTTGTIFKDNDAVTIKLGYNGELQEEFRGFVKRCNLDMPLEVECEGYIRKLRLNVSITANLSKGKKIKDLLEQICKPVGIEVQCMVDFTLYGRNLVNANGVKVLEEIKKCSDNTLTIFFIKPDVLWCGLVYAPTFKKSDVFGLPQVDYRLGYNVVKDNSLKERFPSEEVQILYNGKLATGDSVRTASDNKTAKRKIQTLLNNVHDDTWLKKFANEKADQMNYTGYEGNINAFLQPFALPGYKANIVDARYPKRNGLYLIENTTVTFGVRGARRTCGIGIKLN